MVRPRDEAREAKEVEGVKAGLVLLVVELLDALIDEGHTRRAGCSAGPPAQPITCFACRAGGLRQAIENEEDWPPRKERAGW